MLRGSSPGTGVLFARARAFVCSPEPICFITRAKTAGAFNPRPFPPRLSAGSVWGGGCRPAPWGLSPPRPSWGSTLLLGLGAGSCQRAQAARRQLPSLVKPNGIIRRKTSFGAGCSFSRMLPRFVCVSTEPKQPAQTPGGGGAAVWRISLNLGLVTARRVGKNTSRGVRLWS